MADQIITELIEERDLYCLMVHMLATFSNALF